jgi:hypothetical protein
MLNTYKIHDVLYISREWDMYTLGMVYILQHQNAMMDAMMGSNMHARYALFI